MTALRSRKGSALLIVLGMLSFMIVSAVAFAAFMRFSRLPSSYLRRSSASRLLVKAALARAIDRVDIAVNNNPHPNLGWNTVELNLDGSRRNVGWDQIRTGNRWMDRVLMATNNWSGIDIDDTVATLTLEGLAYIPPPLVSEARYFSRRTKTAQWEQLGFDAGRYAFTAIDVSDCLDVNRLLADYPRSSAPNGRLRISHIFENVDHTAAGSGAGQWDQFMESFRVVEDDLSLDFWTASKPPLISLADFNLALGNRGSVANFKSPFYEYIRNGGSGFYNTGSVTEEERIRNMMFMADGYFPPDDSVMDNNDIGDLNDPNAQPFQIAKLKTTSTPNSTLFQQLIMGGTGVLTNPTKWRFLSMAGLVALFDYLDTDHNPISLACPTVERVPMICGIEPVLNGVKLAVKKEVQPGGDDGQEIVPAHANADGSAEMRTVKQVVTYRIDNTQFAPSLAGGRLSTLVMFPFNHEDPSDTSTFKMDGRFAMFFSSEEMPMRTSRSDTTEQLHLDTKNIPNSGIVNGVIGVKLADVSISKPTNIERQEDALTEYNMTFGAAAGQLNQHLASRALLQVTYQWEQRRTRTNDGGVWGNWSDWTPKFADIQANPPANTINGNGEGTDATSDFQFLKADGTADADLANAGGRLRAAVFGAGKTIRLNAALWLRVKGTGEIPVDMVPACAADDRIQLGLNLGPANILAREITGLEGPLMRFNIPNCDFPFSIAGLDALATAPKDVVLEPKAVYVNDPRYNHAPENWFQTAAGISKQGYLNALPLGQNGRDSDIFMATSDSGYMQSPYEIAFIPRFTDLRSFGASAVRGDMPSMNGINYATTYRTFPANFDDTRAHDFAWKTYSPYDNGNGLNDGDAFEDMGIWSKGFGQKVNPYSDSIPVLMSVFANTPLDWKRCSTNDVQAIPGVPVYADMDAASFNKKYAFNQYSTGGKIRWDDLVAIAENFTNEVGIVARDNNNGNNAGTWEDAWRDLGWRYRDDEFCGVTIPTDSEHKLWTVDRKFLYGYWHDCFAASQQLYLIFVRAEPMMMGGGSAKGIPPQLGSRAVAVVWRDPTPSTEARFPHRTRVLFYRQLE